MKIIIKLKIIYKINKIRNKKNQINKIKVKKAILW